MIPINVDRNVSVRDYEKIPIGHLLVTRTFYTFQGEGPFAGWPAVFVRLAGCNIGAKKDCPWCDTRFNYDEGWVSSFESLETTVNSHPQASLIVFTGGEPLLQHDRICAFVAYYEMRNPGRGLVWQIETNGLLLREDMFETVTSSSIHYVISPKIPSTASTYRPFPHVWTGPDRRIYLKYVVTADEHSAYHRLPNLVDGLTVYHGVPVYVSGMTAYKKAPVGVASIWDTNTIDQAATAANYAHAAKLALERGLRVSYQTHLFGEQE